MINDLPKLKIPQPCKLPIPAALRIIHFELNQR